VKINFGSGNSCHLRLLYSSGQGVVTLSKLSSTALQADFARPLILCIEDEPIHLTLRKKVLERDGYNVIGATTATDALKILSEAPVCAVIADHLLQGTTGTELAKEMKKIKPRVPIILFSGTAPQRLNDVDVYVNKGEPTAFFLGIVRDVVQRFRS
jgi:CheY-like chemotaxis protein